MTLTLAISRPEGLDQALERNLNPTPDRKAKSGEGTPIRTASDDAVWRAATVTEPCPIYVVRHTPVVREQPDLLSGASKNPVAWLYVLFTDDTPVGVAEVAPSGEDQRLGVIAVYDAETAVAFVQAVSEAERLTEHDPSVYELRLLRVPGVYLDALWLHNLVGDWLLPIEPAPAGLSTTQLIRTPAATRALRPLVQVSQTEIDG